MKKLKTKLLFSLLIFIFILIINYRLDNPPLSKYTDETEFVGTVINIKNNTCTTLEVKAKEKILVYDCDNNSYKYGQKIYIRGKLQKPKSSITFDYQKYLLSKNIHYIVYADKIDIISDSKNIFNIIKNKLNEKIENYKCKDYIKALILGGTDLIDDDVNYSYQNNGISHLFAISGMHITFLSTILCLVLNKFFKRRTSLFIISLFLLFYVFITNFSLSIIRAVLMFIFINLSLFKVKTIYYLIFLFLLMLFINPFFVYNVGFCFSYVVTFFLIYFNKKIRNKNFLFKTILISFIAFLAGVPILLKFFYSVNFLSPFLNVIFVPLVTIIIYPLAILTFLFKPLDYLFENIMNIFEQLSLFFEKFDFLTFNFNEISFIAFIIYYVVIFLSLSYKKYYLILIMILLFHMNINTFDNNSKITFIDIGQGDSFFISLANKKGNILIDTGGNYLNKSNMARTRIIPYLKKLGINKLSFLIITHGDYDHMGEAINLVENFKVEKVIFNCGDFNELEQELIKVLDKKKIKYYSCIKELNIDDNKLYFLNNKDYGNENDNSNVIYTELDGYKFMFMGDAGVEVEEDIIEKYNLQDIDVLKVGHHGSKTSSSKNFIEEINPKYSIISVGKNNRYGHPNDDVLDNLEGSKIYRTDLDGSIMFKIKNDKLKVETYAT